ncbi:MULTISPECIES: DUF2336 domain-containing protein [unclassified Chelatococcus]|uniref:DUF2336 domain-containing protein n=1 Tax=unclassified Chelatococcus TaxID=2638111 RepID=UPI0002D8CFCB|nr:MULTISPECIES: DUF2336 domain-containing protein [unclassified Chelatococcus]
MDESSLRDRDLSGLADLAGSGAAEARPTLLRVHTRLFLDAASHSGDDIVTFTTLACGLIPLVDADTRAFVAQALASHPAAPRAVLETLLRSGGDAAAAVIAAVPTLPDRWREEVLASGDRQLLPALATRADLPAATVRELAALGDEAIMLAIARNTAAPVPDEVLRDLTTRARQHAPLACALLARPDLPALDAAALLPFAPAGQRKDILARLAEQARVAPRRTRPAGSAVTRALIGHAADHDRLGFGVVIATTIGLDAEGAARVLTDPSGELLALALIVAGLTPDEAVRIFLTLEPTIARSVETVFTLTERVRTTDAETALLALEACLGRRLDRAGGRGTSHVPAMAPSGSPERAATDASQPAKVEREPVRRQG